MDNVSWVVRELAKMIPPMSERALAVMRAFPPGCTLRAEGYLIPSAFVGSIGTPMSYTDDGQMSVIDDWPPNAGTRGFIDPARATLVSVGLVTPEMVDEAVAVARKKDACSNG